MRESTENYNLIVWILRGFDASAPKIIQIDMIQENNYIFDWLTFLFFFKKIL